MLKLWFPAKWTCSWGVISFRKGKLKIDSAVVDLGTSSELINFYDVADDIQKIGFASDYSKLDASTSTGKAELPDNDLDNTIFAGNDD